jgi:hypothetical protein
MKRRKATWILLMVLLATIASNSALARGHGHGHGRGNHARIGVFIGAPVYPRVYFPVPYYYPAPYYHPSAFMAPPPTYIEQGGAEAAPEPGYWYYCTDAKAYYPYVKQCPGGWQRVAPSPPPG